MPLHDFAHPACNVYVPDYYVPVDLRASEGAPLCVRCGTPLDWVPAIGAMDFGPAGGAGFKSFTITEEVRGREERIEIDSLAKLRRTEREFEQHARNGEARPLVWRDYAQSRSNGDVHTLSANPADPHGVKPVVDQALASKKVTPRKGEAVTKVHGTL